MLFPDPLISLSLSIAQWAAAKPLILKVWLFGSRVRGDHKPDSDLDIAIKLDPNEIKGIDHKESAELWAFDSKWLQELQEISPYKVQLEQYIDEKRTPNIEKGIVESSRLIYEKKSSISRQQSFSSVKAPPPQHPPSPKFPPWSCRRYKYSVRDTGSFVGR